MSLKPRVTREEGQPVLAGQGVAGKTFYGVACKGQNPDKGVTGTAVLVVHRLAVLRVGMRSLLTGLPGFSICGETDDPREARELFISKKPSAVIVGLTLRGGADGILLIRELLDVGEGAAIVVMTQRSDLESCRRALRAGALGYVAAQDHASELPRALEEAMSRRHYASPSCTQHLLASLAVGLSRYRRRFERLSDRELQVFQLLGAGIGAKRAADELHLSVKTVETHYMRIKGKLRIRSSEQLKERALLYVSQQSREPPST